MAFTRTWSAAYEAQPSDTENISLGASRIRNLKEDLQERLVVDHSHAGDADDGKHKQVTFVSPLGSDPAFLANHGFIYTKDVSAKVELFWVDEDGNVVQITSAGAIKSAFVAGTSMLFYQSAAPTGWTKDTSSALNNHALRVVTSTGWTTGSKGSNSFTNALGPSPIAGAVTLTAAQSGLPSHTHDYNKVVINTGSGVIGDSGFAANQPITAATAAVSAANAASSHIHAMDINYFDVIRATKD